MLLFCRAHGICVSIVNLKLGRKSTSNKSQHVICTAQIGRKSYTHFVLSFEQLMICWKPKWPTFELTTMNHTFSANLNLLQSVLHQTNVRLGKKCFPKAMYTMQCITYCQLCNIRKFPKSNQQLFGFLASYKNFKSTSIINPNLTSHRKITFVYTTVLLNSVITTIITFCKQRQFHS